MEAKQHAPLRGHKFKAVLGLFAICGFVGAGLLSTTGRVTSGAAIGERLEEASSLVAPERRLMTAAQKRCIKYPYLKFIKATHRNLGGHGPDKGEEGLFYEVVDKGGGAGAEYGKKVVMKVKVRQGPVFKPWSPRMSGMQGPWYGSVNIKSGSAVSLSFKFYDQETGEKLTMEEFAFTFFDLDTGKQNKSVESVTLKDFTEVHVTDNTEVQQIKIGNGYTKFMASTYGTGEDNPKDPMALTDQQKNRAVTVMYHNIDQIKAKLEASQGRGPRFFTYIARPSLLCAITVSENALPPLVVKSPIEEVHAVHELEGKGYTFEKYLKNTGDKVKKGDGVAVFKDKDGKEVIWKAPEDGTITAETPIQPGDDMEDRLRGGELIIIKKDMLPALEGEEAAKAAVVPEGKNFMKYEVEVGDTIAKGDNIVQLQDRKTGELEELKAAEGGQVAAEQTGLHKHDPIELVADHNLVTVGKRPPLPCDDDEGRTEAPKGSKFLEYKVKEGDLVQEGDIIALVQDEDGTVKSITASRTGVVSSLQDGLEKGQRIEDVMQDTNLATVAKLPPLEVKPGEGGAIAPEGQYRFKEFLVKEGDEVEKGDPIATVVKKNGEEHSVRAPKGGSIEQLQDELRPGDEIDEIMEDGDLAVIGPFSELKADGFREVSVKADGEAVFEEWMVHEGDHVELGQGVAKVSMPGRRLQDGSRRLGGLITIPSPAWGTVKKEVPLKAGEKIGDQQVGSNIATIDMGLPWWIYLLGALICLCCILCCLFAAMKKQPKELPPVPPEPVPEPKPEEPVPSPAPEPVPPPKPDGLRLDFEDQDKQVHTKYCHYRPLGIKHSSKAPIFAEDFTINSYAKMDLGVKEHWKLIRIDDEDVKDNSDFTAVNDKLHNHMKDFKLWPLPLEFEDKDGNRHEFKFDERPIGIEFSNKAPIQVSKVYDDSPAHKQGVQEQWKIVTIGECDVSNNNSFREVIGYFKEGVLPLDKSENNYV